MADFIVSLTTGGRRFEAQSILFGYGAKVTHFAVGSGGHDPGTGLPLPLNTDTDTLPGQFFGPEVVDEGILLTPTCPQWTCILQPGESVGGISDLGLYASVTYVPPGSPPDAPVVGSMFLYAIAYFALRYKAASSRETFYVTLKT